MHDSNVQASETLETGNVREVRRSEDQGKAAHDPDADDARPEWSEVVAGQWLAERLEGRSSAVLNEPDTHGVRDALDVPTEKIGKLLVLENALAACATALAA